MAIGCAHSPFLRASARISATLFQISYFLQALLPVSFLSGMIAAKFMQMVESIAGEITENIF